MEKMFRTLVIGAAAVVLTFSVGGCSKKKVASEGETMAPVTMETGQAPGAERGIHESGMATAESLESKEMMEETGTVLEGRTHAPMLPVYFDFDKSNIREDQTARLEKNAEYLSKNGMVKVRVEGNCDERGTNEYNMALGQRRALSAKKYLINLGINGDRLETISYGEEKPLLYGHDEYSWAQNRRDDFMIIR